MIIYVAAKVRSTIVFYFSCELHSTRIPSLPSVELFQIIIIVQVDAKLSPLIILNDNQNTLDLTWTCCNFTSAVLSNLTNFVIVSEFLRANYKLAKSDFISQMVRKNA